MLKSDGGKPVSNLVPYIFQTLANLAEDHRRSDRARNKRSRRPAKYASNVRAIARNALELLSAQPHFGAMQTNAPARLKVWFDGACPMCIREIAMMRRLDRAGAIDFVDVSGEGDPSCPIDQAQLLARFHAEEDGKVLSGAEAFAAMWRAIPLLRPIGLIAKNRAVLVVLERLYVWFLRVRPHLQKRLS